MKNYLFLAAAASMVLASCVSDETTNVEKQTKQKITFDSPVLYNNVNTRANIYGEVGSHIYGSVAYTYPQEESFIIYAVSHTEDFAGWANATEAEFDGDSIMYDMNVDGWAPKNGDEYYFWENGKKMSFAATSPATLEQGEGWNGRSYGADGLTITDFAVPTEASHQYDLLFSTRVCDQTSADMMHDASYYSGIPLTFQHALSSIRFSISNTSSEEVILTDITLSGVKYKGTFKENLTENTADYTQYEKGVNVNPQWTVADDVIANPYVAFKGNIKFFESPRYVSALVEEIGTETDVVNQLLLMPQELTDEVILTVHYTVNGNENTKEVQLNLQKESVGNTLIDKWEMGKRYTYRLVYSTASADKDKIYFAPGTEAWVDVDVIQIEL
ncbi:MAG: fimbrillin family protein [Coprobacter sp.]|nr:fimbrillin family protein [Coprobacter sp.]